MAYFWLLLAIIAYQSGFSVSQSSPYPMSFDFLDVTSRTQEAWSSTLAFYTNNNLKPIAFPSSNKSADYTSQTWMDPCYDRWYATKTPSFIIFWLVNEEMFCEVMSKGPLGTSYAPAFPSEYLLRIERGGDRCPQV